MKISVTCGECLTNSIDSKAKKENELMISKNTYLQINDENVYPFTCSNGHKNAMIHQQEKHELLFEYAVNAMVDGYYRETVSSISSSLERTYEYAVRIISMKNGTSGEVFELAWKHLNKFSERQLGAFITSYIQEFKMMPALMPEKDINFRNRIIHKGYFPSYEETLSYAEAALDNIIMILSELESNCKAQINESELTRTVKMKKEADKYTKYPITYWTPTIVSLSLHEGRIEIPNYITSIESREKRWW